MKTTFCYLVLLLSSIGFAQNPISFGNNQIPKSKFQYSFSGITLNPISFSFNYRNRKNFASGYALEVYNSTTQMNDNFVRVKEAYYMSNIKSFSNYGFDGIKMDSFNPYGTNDVGSALISGLINMFISSKDGF